MKFWFEPGWVTKLFKGAWFGFMGICGVPKGEKPEDHPEIVAHEEEHVVQEDKLGGGIRRKLGDVAARIWGGIRFLFSYITDRRFRLEMEVDAEAKGMMLVPESQWPQRIEDFSIDLAGSFYHEAALSVAEARDLLTKAVEAEKAKRTSPIT